MVLVSVIMCSCNHEKYLAQAINSVLNQTFKDLELLITDDYSTDNSPKIIADFQKKDSRVHAVFHLENLGISKTLNDGLELINGKYVCFLDSDDVWVENKLEKQLKVLEKDDSKLLWSEAEIIDSQGQRTGKLVTEHLFSRHKKNGYLFESLLNEMIVFRQSMMFRADYIKGIRFDAQLRYVNDHRFLVDLAVNHEFVFMPEILVKYRVHTSNVTAKNTLVWANDKILVRKYFLRQYGKQMSSKAKADINYKIGFYLSRLGKQEEAKKYYLQALKTDHTHVASALYTVLTLTAGKGLIGKILVGSFKSTTCFVNSLKTGVLEGT